MDLITERITLRPDTADELPDYVQLYGDNEVNRFAGGIDDLPEQLASTVTVLADEWRERGFGQSAVRLLEIGEFLGRMGLHYFNEWDEVELGYVLTHTAHGKGYAREGRSAPVDMARLECIANRRLPLCTPTRAPQSNSRLPWALPSTGSTSLSPVDRCRCNAPGAHVLPSELEPPA